MYAVQDSVASNSQRGIFYGTPINNLTIAGKAANAESFSFERSNYMPRAAAIDIVGSVAVEGGL